MMGPRVTGSPDNNGTPPPAFMSVLKALGASGGGIPKSMGKGSRGGQGSRGLEKPSLARSAAISRRLNGAPSQGTELKGL